MNYSFREIADKHFSLCCEQIKFDTKEEWLKLRMNGIGGSDVASIMGVSPWSNIQKIYNSKFETQELLDTPAIRFGNTFEPIMFNIFDAKHSNDYAVLDYKDTLFRNIWMPFLQASVDGVLVDKSSLKVGVLEIKTQQGRIEKWIDDIPIYYYYQAIHYFNTLNIDFVVFYTMINSTKNEQTDMQILKPIRLNRNDVLDDMHIALEHCKDFWKHIESKEEII